MPPEQPTDTEPDMLESEDTYLVRGTNGATRVFIYRTMKGGRIDVSETPDPDRLNKAEVI